MSHEPLISIIMPAYNAAAFIAAAIQSVLRQTYQNWQLIIINDGSTDNTEAIILLNQDPRIEYIKKSNGGVSSARNVGLQRMFGKYFCFLDADDVLPPRSLEARMSRFMLNPELDFVDGVVQVFNESMDEKIRTFRPKFRGWPLLPLLRLSDSCFFGLSWMIKRGNSVYAMDDQLSHGEDYFFYLTLSRKGGIYDYTDEEILHYRTHHRSAMRDLEGLHKGYRRIYAQLVKWPEFAFSHRLVYNIKMRKFIFLSFLSVKEYKNAFNALFS